jgi:hypothetical protein
VLTVKASKKGTSSIKWRSKHKRFMGILQFIYLRVFMWQDLTLNILGTLFTTIAAQPK